MPSEATDWKPTRHLDGRYQISVVYEHENGRYVSDAVRLDRYIELFEKKLLKWQQKSTERPKHNPPLEIARALLAEEKEYLEQKALEVYAYRAQEERPRRRAVIELPPEPEPGADIEEEAVEEPEAPPTPDPLPAPSAEEKAYRRALMREVMETTRKQKPMALIDRYRHAASVLLGQGKVPTAEALAQLVDIKLNRVRLFLRFNPDFAKGVEPLETPSEPMRHEVPLPKGVDPAVARYAENMRTGFSVRDLEIVDAVIAGRALHGLQPSSVPARISGLCTKAGIPASTNRGQFEARMRALKQAREYLKAQYRRKAGT